MKFESLPKLKLCNICTKKISRNESTHLNFAYSPANGNRERIVTWNDVIWPSITWAFDRGCYSYRRGIRKFSSSHWARSFGAKKYCYIQNEAVWGNETPRQVCDQTVMFPEIPLFVYWFVLYTFLDSLMEAFVNQCRGGVPLSYSGVSNRAELITFDAHRSFISWNNIMNTELN